MEGIDGPRVGLFALGILAGWVVTGGSKAAGWLPCDLARKTNHVAAFVGGALCFGWLHVETARPSVYAACGILIGMVALACVGRNYLPFRAMFLGNTRTSDTPHEAFYFWSSWSISMLGLVAIDGLFDDLVVTRIAALVVGIGDGIAEPIGRRFGYRRFRVPSLTKPAYRSLEGSASVFFGSLIVLLACCGLETWVSTVVIAAVVTLVEAVSPHGLDNLTVPLVAATMLHERASFASW